MSECVCACVCVFLPDLRKSIAKGAQTRTTTEMSSFCTSNQMQPQLQTHTHTYVFRCVCVCCYLLRICNYTRQHSDSSLLASKAAWSILKAYVQQFSFFINYNSLPLSLSLFGREGLRRTRVHMIRTLFKCSTNFQSTADTE